MNIIMRLIALIFLLVAPSFVGAKQKIDWPTTKYEDGVCITPTNTSWTWYGKTAYIEDIVYSKYLDGFAYKINIYGLDRMQFYDFFAIPSIDANTAQVQPCPN